MYARLVVMHLSGFTKGNHAFTYDRNFDVATLAVLLLSVQLETRTRQGGCRVLLLLLFSGRGGGLFRVRSGTRLDPSQIKKEKEMKQESNLNIYAIVMHFHSFIICHSFAKVYHLL